VPYGTLYDNMQMCINGSLEREPASGQHHILSTSIYFVRVVTYSAPEMLTECFRAIVFDLGLPKEQLRKPRQIKIMT